MIESPLDLNRWDVCGHKWVGGQIFFFGHRGFASALARRATKLEGLSSAWPLPPSLKLAPDSLSQLYAAPSRCRQAALLFLSVYCSASYRGSRPPFVSSTWRDAHWWPSLPLVKPMAAEKVLSKVLLCFFPSLVLCSGVFDF